MEHRGLEEEFFAKENAELLTRLRRKAAKEEQRELLRQVVKVKDDAFLDRLIAMGIGPQTAVALRLIPLVFVAWADGKIDENERQAILRAAEERGMAAKETARPLLDTWLTRKPEGRLLALWKEYIRERWNRFTPDEQLQMRENVLNDARAVAEAAGGFLGLTSKISTAEQAVLDDIESVVS